MTNKFRGYCLDCRRNVPSGHGQLKKQDGRWMVSCGTAPTKSFGRFPALQIPVSQPVSKYDYEPDFEGDLARQEQAEYDRGRADAGRYQDNVRYMGQEYADAEEMAWELKDPDPAY